MNIAINAVIVHNSYVIIMLQYKRKLYIVTVKKMNK